MAVKWHYHSSKKLYRKSLWKRQMTNYSSSSSNKHSTDSGIVAAVVRETVVSTVVKEVSAAVVLIIGYNNVIRVRDQGLRCFDTETHPKTVSLLEISFKFMKHHCTLFQGCDWLIVRVVMSSRASESNWAPRGKATQLKCMVFPPKISHWQLTLCLVVLTGRHCPQFPLRQHLVPACLLYISVS